MQSKYNRAALSLDKPLDLTAKKSPSTEAQPSVEAKPNDEGPLPDIQMVNFGSIAVIEQSSFVYPRRPSLVTSGHALLTRRT